MASLSAARAHAALLCLLLAVAGCDGCRRKSPSAREGVERVLARGALLVVVAPELGLLGDRLEQLQQLKLAGFLAPTQGFPDARAWVSALVSELGVDLRSAVALERSGIDARAPAALGIPITARPYLALPVKDADALDAALATLARTRLGAATRGEERIDGVLLRTFAGGARSGPRLGYVLAHGYALVAVDEGIAGLVAMGRLSAGDSLASEPVLARARTRLPARGDLLLHAPPGSPLLATMPVESATALVALRPAALSVSLDAPWKPGLPYAAALAQQVREVELSGLLPADAFLRVRYDGPPAALAGVWQVLLGRWTSDAGVDLQRDLFAHLRPGLVASLSLAARPPLSRALSGEELRRANPFDYVELSGAVTVDSADGGRMALEKAIALAPHLGATMRRADRPGALVALTQWAQGEGLHLGVREDRAVFASTVGRLNTLLSAEDAGEGGGGIEEDAAFQVRLDRAALAQGIRALPESAWGLGGFAVRAAALRWLDAIDDLTALRVSAASREGALVAHAVLELAPGPSPRAP